MASGIHAVGGYVDNLELSCVHCTQTKASTPGSPYVRYGRKTCPSGHKKLWSSALSGSWYEHRGSGMEYLCLHPVPKYIRTVAGEQGGGRLHNAEYQFSDGGVVSYKPFHDKNAPCAVCERPARRGSSFLMPGKASCPSGFKLDYHGFLVAE